MFLAPADSGCGSLRQVVDLGLEEPRAPVDIEIGSNVTVKLVPANAQPVIRYRNLNGTNWNNVKKFLKLSILIIEALYLE